MYYNSSNVDRSNYPYYRCIESLPRGAEDEEITPNEPTPQAEIPHLPTDILTIIQADTIKYRSMTDTKAVRKNVSLPAWMSKLADKRGINCSKVLQEALTTKLL